MRDVFIEGTSLDLRVLNFGDLEGNYPAWFNDFEVCKGNSHHRFPNTVELTRQYIEGSLNDDSMLVLAIVAKPESRHIGNISLQSIDYIGRSAEFAIVIGEKDYWGKGMALEASKLIVRHGFEQLNLHRIYCGTPASNASMLKLAAALGMKEEGRSRDAFFKHGRYQDIVQFGILDDEFTGP